MLLHTILSHKIFQWPRVFLANHYHRYRAAFLPLLILGMADALILSTELSYLRLVSGIILTFILPGYVWLKALHWSGTQAGLERLVLTGGASAAISAVVLLGAAYWPGPLTLTTTLIALNSAILAGLLGALLTTHSQSTALALLPADDAESGWTWPGWQTGIILALILGVAFYLRFAHLGYAEFHEDALENMRLAVRAMKGEEYAPFLDSKGPVHWLLPASLWLTTGWVNEAIARFPFAFSSLLTVLGVFILGHRMSGRATIGLVGSALVAINGFFVAFARHIENRSLIILWGLLAAWCAYQFYRTRNGRSLILGSFFLAAGLIAHPDVLLYLPPFGLMIGYIYYRQPGLLAQTWKAALLAGLLFIGLVAAFYIPYLNDPSLARTEEYLAAERIGTEFLYNSLATMLDQNKNYNTRYYAPWLILFSGLFVANELRKFKRVGPALIVIFALAVTLTVAQPELWQWGNFNGAFLPYGLLLLVLVISPQSTFESKSLLLWFGIPFLALEFLAKDAADHIQIAYPAWSLLAALGFQQYWGYLTGRGGLILRRGTVVLLGVLLGLIIYYLHLQFLETVSTYHRLENEAKYNEGSIFRLLYGELPRPRKLHGNPRLGGWKVVGVLYDQGILQGDFRSHDESFAVPIWYTHQTPRSCFTDPQNYFVSLKGRDRPEKIDELLQQGYGLTRIVFIDRALPMMYLFEKNRPSLPEPEIFEAEDYRLAFDRSATPERYSETDLGAHPLGLNFGQKLFLSGYDVNQTTFKPGQTIAINLYWQALAPMAVRYRAFVHVETDRMWGQHDDDPACRLRTDEWRPQQYGQGQFRVTLDPTIPPGTYPVTIGLYHPDTWERFEITDQQGQSLGTSFELLKIQVE